MKIAPPKVILMSATLPTITQLPELYNSIVTNHPEMIVKSFVASEAKIGCALISSNGALYAPHITSKTVNEIKIIFSNGLSVPVEEKDCHEARDNDQKFTDFVFSKYVSAKDLIMEPGKLTGTYDKDYFRRVSRNLSIEKVHNVELSENLQNKVDLLMTKIDNLENIYNQHIPKIMENLDSLNKKMDTIYKKMVGNDNPTQ
jgi:hypothetical protein